MAKNLKRQVTELRLLRQGLLAHADGGRKELIPVSLTELEIGVIAYALSYTSIAEHVARFPDHELMLDHISEVAKSISEAVEKSDPEADWDGMVAEADRWLESYLNADNN